MVTAEFYNIGRTRLDDQSVIEKGAGSPGRRRPGRLHDLSLLPASFSATEGVALMPGSKDPEIRARMAQRQVQADELANQSGELRLSGWSYRAIGQAVGCSPSTAKASWERFRKQLVVGTIPLERDLLVGRLTKQYRQLGSRMAAGDPKAHAVGVEILRLMSDVLGLQAPARVQVQGGPSFTRFEFVVEPLPEEPPPPLEGSQRRLLEPAATPDVIEEAS